MCAVCQDVLRQAAAAVQHFWLWISCSWTGRVQQEVGEVAQLTQAGCRVDSCAPTGLLRAAGTMLIPMLRGYHAPEASAVPAGHCLGATCCVSTCAGL